MADILLDLNRIEEATKLLERALPCAAQAHDIYLLNCCRSSLAVSYSLLGQHAEAERLAHQGLAEGLTQPQGFDIGLLLLALGQAEWRYGNFELAYQHLSQAERRFRTSGVAWEHSRTLLYLAATQRSMKDQKGALRRLWQALRKIQEKGHQVILKAEEHRLTDLFQLGISHAENHPLHHLLIASKASTADYRTDLHHTHQQPETPPSISSLTIYPVADWEDEEPGGESPQQASSARDYLPAESSDLLALTPSPPLRMEARAFGQPQVIINGQPITHWRTTKALELFFFLLAHNRAAHREAIIEALWPDLPMGRVDSTFRSATYWLRRAIGEEGLLRTSTWYRLNPGWWSDVAEFESLLARAAEAYRGQQIDETRACYKQAFSLYVGHYLEPIYSDWAERRRDELRSLYLEALNRAALLEEHEGAINEAQTLWKRALKIDPCAEEAHRGLIRCYIRSSNRAAAIRQYHNCIRLLKEQLGVDPAPKTVALYAILSGEQQ
jgi:DNA-binding SARP family transcriptional activator